MAEKPISFYDAPSLGGRSDRWFRGPVGPAHRKRGIRIVVSGLEAGNRKGFRHSTSFPCLARGRFEGQFLGSGDSENLSKDRQTFERPTHSRLADEKMKLSTSLHGLNADTGLTRRQRRWYTRLNWLNNHLLPNWTDKDLLVRRFVPDISSEDWKRLKVESSPTILDVSFGESVPYDTVNTSFDFPYKTMMGNKPFLKVRTSNSIFIVNGSLLFTHLQTLFCGSTTVILRI